ncbi:MAG: hypothetical protein QM776_09990 [Rhodocyclaceae bacterium]
MSRRTLLWLLFAASGALAWGLAQWEAIFPSVRIVAGWYAIFVVIVVVLVALVKISIYLGPFEPGDSVFDYFDFFD